jgi:hypothetical protein
VKIPLPLTLLTLALTGCAVPQQERFAKYDPAEYARYAGSGSGRITGQAFAKTVGGDVKYAAGNTVWLYPVTSMSTEWYQTAIKGGKPMKAGDQRMMQHSRSTVADGSGNFEFSGLPAGNYYVVTQVTWGVPTGMQFFPVETTGSALHAKVHVSDGESKRVILTPSNNS